MSDDQDLNDAERRRALFVISVAAELAGMHPQTLRIYERKGLIEPARTGGRSRRYSANDIAVLRRISELTDRGLNLAGVKAVLELEAKLDVTRRQRDLARQRLDEVEAAGRLAFQRARQEHNVTVESVHRLYRRDLVPVRNGLVPFRRTR